jgi:hypothetical protein
MNSDPLEQLRRYILEGEMRLQRPAKLVEQHTQDGLPLAAARAKKLLAAMERAQLARCRWLIREEAYIRQQQNTAP